MKVLFVTSQWPTDDNPAAAPFVKREVESLRRSGIDVDIYIYEGGWSFGTYRRAFYELHRKLRAENYDLIHARFGQCGIIARAQLKLPIVLTYGGSDIDSKHIYLDKFFSKLRLKGYILNGFSRLLSLLVDEVIVVSEHLGTKLPRRHVHVIPSGIDLSLFKPYDQAGARQKLGLPMDKKLVLFAGNPANSLKRFSLASQACDLAKQQIDLGLIVLTNRSSIEVPWYMSACDALILTSTHEGSPNVVKEALACNLPIVSLDVGDVKKRIRGVDSCAVVTDDHPESIAPAIVQILSQTPRPQLRCLVEDLGSELWATRVIEVYNKALAKQRYQHRSQR